MIKPKLLAALAVILFGCYHPCVAQTPPTTEIHLSLSAEVSDTALSGRVYVMFDRNVYVHPILSEIPDESSYWFAADIDNWKPGTDFIMAGDVSSFPFSLAELPTGDYAAQAVFDINTIDRNYAMVPGNIYSDPVAAVIRSNGKNIIRISLQHEVEKVQIHESGFIKEVRLQSRLLSDYLKRPT